MSLKYIFLILSIVVILFIFYRQYHSGLLVREYMTTEKDILPSSQETSKECSNGEYSDSVNLPLREYCVKSSFNSAYNGSDVSIETLLQRIKEGYRFIDLNVFSASGEIYVGFSPDNAPTLISNKMLLADALKCINDNAFSSATAFDASLSNVASYPIFVHIRVYRVPGSTVDVIGTVAKMITGEGTSMPPSYTSNYLRNADKLPEQISGCTPLSKLMGRILFSMDILNILEIYAPINYQNASTVPPETTAALQTFVNILTGGSTFPAFYRYVEDSLIYRTNTLGVGNSAIKGSLQTNVKNMYISFPHPDDVTKVGAPANSKATGVIQPDIASFVLSRSIQFTPLRVYLADTNIDV